MKLTWHAYKYYPYERQLALREVARLLGVESVRETAAGLELLSEPKSENASRLVYFSQIHRGRLAVDTVQARLERAASAGRNRQATRYSVHGLHEYKGKFNPQVAKAVLNIFGVRPGDNVLDPFCGSGTSLVECAQMGVRGFGTDLNPFAVFLANTKLLALKTPAQDLRTTLKGFRTSFSRRTRWRASVPDDARGTYLRSWFDTDILVILESVRRQIADRAGSTAPIFLAIASNLLREYSQQDPNDLRVRRRTSPLPSLPFPQAFLIAADAFLDRLEETQAIIGLEGAVGGAVLCDVTKLSQTHPLQRFDAALTSPPYAMALPYIDTQRLSLVWLDLAPPNRILKLEADLIGSREVRGQAKRELQAQLDDNAKGIPAEQLKFCKTLQKRLGPSDGFRRLAVPTLLYRYFSDMSESFRAVRQRMKPGAPYALIVGHNHTVLGGIRQDIDTPHHLTNLAKHAGWKVDELISLQTYQRYGYHMDNAVTAETLILLRNS